jgi:hypothetical protein
MQEEMTFEQVIYGEQQSGGNDCRREATVIKPLRKIEFLMHCPDLSYGIYEVRVAIQATSDLERPGIVGIAGIISIPWESSSMNFETRVFRDKYLYKSKPGETHSYQIRAVNRLGVGVTSIPSKLIYNAEAPVAPFLRVVNRTSTQIFFEWGEPFDNGARISSYAVYRSDSRVYFGNLRKFVDSNVVAGQLYNYQVSAWNVIGEGQPSAPFPVYACRLPQKPNKYQIKHEYLGFRLSWNRPADNGCVLKGFEITLNGVVIANVADFGSKQSRFEYLVERNFHNLELGKPYFVETASISDGGRNAIKSEEHYLAHPMVGQRHIGIKEQTNSTVVLHFHIEDDGYRNLYPNFLRNYNELSAEDKMTKTELFYHKMLSVSRAASKQRGGAFSRAEDEEWNTLGVLKEGSSSLEGNKYIDGRRDPFREERRGYSSDDDDFLFQSDKYSANPNPYQKRVFADDVYQIDDEVLTGFTFHATDATPVSRHENGVSDADSGEHRGLEYETESYMEEVTVEEDSISHGAYYSNPFSELQEMARSQMLLAMIMRDASRDVSSLDLLKAFSWEGRGYSDVDMRGSGLPTRRNDDGHTALFGQVNDAERGERDRRDGSVRNQKKVNLGDETDEISSSGISGAAGRVPRESASSGYETTGDGTGNNNDLDARRKNINKGPYTTNTGVETNNRSGHRRRDFTISAANQQTWMNTPKNQVGNRRIGQQARYYLDKVDGIHPGDIANSYKNLNEPGHIFAEKGTGILKWPADNPQRNQSHYGPIEHMLDPYEYQFAREGKDKWKYFSPEEDVGRFKRKSSAGDHDIGNTGSYHSDAFDFYRAQGNDQRIPGSVFSRESSMDQLGIPSSGTENYDTGGFVLDKGMNAFDAKGNSYSQGQDAGGFVPQGYTNELGKSTNMHPLGLMDSDDPILREVRNVLLERGVGSLGRWMESVAIPKEETRNYHGRKWMEEASEEEKEELETLKTNRWNYPDETGVDMRDGAQPWRRESKKASVQQRVPPVRDVSGSSGSSGSASSSSKDNLSHSEAHKKNFPEQPPRRKLIRVTMKIKGLEFMRKYCFKVYARNPLIPGDGLYSKPVCAVAAQGPRIGYVELESTHDSNEILVKFPTATSDTELVGYEVRGILQNRNTGFWYETVAYSSPEYRQAKLSCDYRVSDRFERIVVRGLSPVAGFGIPQVLKNVACEPRKGMESHVYPPRLLKSEVIKNSGNYWCQITADFFPVDYLSFANAPEGFNDEEDGNEYGDEYGEDADRLGREFASTSSELRVDLKS